MSSRYEWTEKGERARGEEELGMVGDWGAAGGGSLAAGQSFHRVALIFRQLETFGTAPLYIAFKKNYAYVFLYLKLF